MRHRKKEVKLNRTPSATKALLRNLAADIVLHERIRTTQAKAKAVRSLVEKSITTGKTPTLAARRKLLQVFYTDYPVNKIFDVLAPRYATRNGGYTRITKLGHRKNDAAEMVQIELV